MDHADLNITIIGRSDNDENVSKNMLVSRSRAVYVKEFLVDNGIDPERITVYSDELIDDFDKQVDGQIMIIRTDTSNGSDMILNR